MKSPAPRNLDGIAKELRAAYFRTYAGTHKCHDAQGWDRVAERAIELLLLNNELKPK